MHEHVPPLLVVLVMAVAAPHIGGAMLTVILFPIAALRLTGRPIDRALARLHDRDGL